MPADSSQNYGKLSLYLRKDAKKLLQRIAEQENLSQSRMLRRLAAEGLRARGVRVDVRDWL